MNADFTYKVLNTFEVADCHDLLFWRCQPDGSIKFAAMCNDVFWWATADAEDIEEEDLPLLQQTLRDLKEIDQRHYLPELYAARKRKLRPQGAFYDAAKADDKGLSELFDAAGPPREADILNPKGR